MSALHEYVGLPHHEHMGKHLWMLAALGGALILALPIWTIAAPGGGAPSRPFGVGNGPGPGAGPTCAPADGSAGQGAIVRLV